MEVRLYYKPNLTSLNFKFMQKYRITFLQIFPVKKEHHFTFEAEKGADLMRIIMEEMDYVYEYKDYDKTELIDILTQKL